MSLINPAEQAANQPRQDTTNVDTVEGSTDDVSEIFDQEQSVTFDDAIDSISQDTGIDLKEDMPEGLEAAEAESSSDAATTDDGSLSATEAGDSATEAERRETDGEDGQAGASAENDEEAPADEADAEGDEAQDDGPQRQVDQILEELNSEYDDFAAESLDDLAHQYKLEREGNDVVMDVFDNHPQVLDLVTQIVERRKAGEPVDLAQLAQEAIPEMQAPDPQEDPEAYAEWARQQGRQEAMKEQEKQQLQELRGQIQAMRRNAEEGVEQAAEELGIEADQARQTVASVITQPQEHNMPLLILRGMKFESAIEQAREEARKEGRNEAIQQIRNKKQTSGDGIPDFSGTGSGADQAEPAEKDDQPMRDLAASWSNNRDPLAQMLQ